MPPPAQGEVYNSLLASVVGLILLFTIIYFAFEVSNRRIRKLLPEAESHIQRAIIFLEREEKKLQDKIEREQQKMAKTQEQDVESSSLDLDSSEVSKDI